MKINLSELIYHIQESSDDMRYFYNKENGKYELYDIQKYGYLEDLDSLDVIFNLDWEQEVLNTLIDIRDNEDKYIEIPYCTIQRGLDDREKELEYLKEAINWCNNNDILPVNE